MSEEVLNLLKAHLHEDGTECEPRLKMLYNAAAAELANAGIPDDQSDLFLLMAFEKVRCWYDGAEEPKALQHLVNQSKMGSDTAGIL